VRFAFRRPLGFTTAALVNPPLPSGWVDSSLCAVTMIDAKPLTLTGRHVQLEPLTAAHLAGLAAALPGGDLWRWLPRWVKTQDELRTWIDEALAEQRRGEAVPFATVLLADSRVVGTTRFMAISAAHRRVEIGGTIIGQPWQRTLVNTEVKYLMLRHAFEAWGCVRVELKTHARNARSRAAILRLGAVEEGTLRSHMLQPDGSRRDTVYFSILDTEWPAVRERLERRMARTDAP